MMRLMMKSACLVILTMFLASSCARILVEKTRLTLGPEDARWVRKTLNRMSLEEKIGQMIVWRYSGKFHNLDSEYMNHLKTLVVERKIGGLILFGGEVYETAHLTNSLQALSRHPLLIASDFERGAGNQITGATLFPPLMALGAADSEELAYQMGKITAVEGRAMGIHMTYAPVVDVNVNPENPIINTRAIGEDPDQVSRLALAFIRGCQEYGMLATAKHFPGHGDTDLDSHSLLPTINADMDRLEMVELFPFKQAISAGVQAIMTAHLHVPALDPTPNLPATLSPVIMNSLLREKLGFKGLIVTDAMEMGGITTVLPPGEAVLKAVQAGVDLILLPLEAGEAVDTLVQAVSSGQVSEERINASVRRILETKARLGLHRNKFVRIETLAEKIASRENLKQAARIFENSLTLVKNEKETLPLGGSSRKIAVFSLGSDPGEYFAGRVFMQEMGKRQQLFVKFFADPFTGKEHIEQAVEKAKSADVVVFSLFSSLKAWKGSVGIEEKHIEIIKDFEGGTAKVVVISFGSPYFLRHFPGVDVYVCAYRNQPQAQAVAAKALFGEIEIRGRLPVSIPGLYPSGHGLVSPPRTRNQ